MWTCFTILPTLCMVRLTNCLFLFSIFHQNFVENNVSHLKIVFVFVLMKPNIFVLTNLSTQNKFLILCRHIMFIENLMCFINPVFKDPNVLLIISVLINIIKFLFCNFLSIFHYDGKSYRGEKISSNQIYPHWTIK